MKQTDVAYIAGLFDGEGSITYKQYMRKRKGQKKAYPTWSIRMEMAMTEKSALMLVQDILNVGTVNQKDTEVNMLKVGKNNGVGNVNTGTLTMFQD